MRLALGKSGCILKIRAVKIKRLQQNKKAQTLVEYALILALISVVVVAVIFALGAQVKHVFTTISSQLAVVGSSH